VPSDGTGQPKKQLADIHGQVRAPLRRFRRADGGGGPPPDLVPFTTIAWRIGHLGALCLGGFAASAFGDAEPTPDSHDFSATAAGVRAFIDFNYAAWHDGLMTLDEAG
jgi:hypothetical protein